MKLAFVVAEVAAYPLTVALRVLHMLAAPFARLSRLASLRSRVDGRIPVTTQFDGPVRTVGRPRVTFGEHCRLGRDVLFETGPNGRVTIGDHVRINRGTVVVAYDRVEIGDHTLIGEYATVRDADHGIDAGALIRSQPHEAAPVHIGRDVWIARGSAVLKGVTLGDGAVIGANSVVTRDIPAGTIAVGAPAREVARRDGVSLPADSS